MIRLALLLRYCSLMAVVLFSLLITPGLPAEATLSAQTCPRLVLGLCLMNPENGQTGLYYLKNANLGLVVQLEKGRLQQVSLAEAKSGRVFANSPNLEEGGAFRLTLLQPGSGQQVELGAADFHFTAVRRTTALDWLRPSRWLAANGVSSPLGDNLVLDGVAQWNSTTLRLHLHYSFPPEADFVQVQLGLEPTSAAEGWVVSNAASARWQLDTTMNPTPRNPQLDSALYYQKRWKLPPSSLPGNWWVAPNGEGLYAFSNSPFGREYYQPNNLAVLDQYDHQPLSEGFQGGFVVLGYYPSGGAEMGYTRYVQYLTRYVSRMTRQNKRAPVFFNTWIPWTNQIDQKVIDKALDQTKQAGYYDLLHVDAGWEGASSLQLDTKKFPGGLDYIQQKAHAQNLGLGLWINPYSDSYFGYVNYETVHREKRDWHVVLTEGFLLKQGFNRGAFQVLSPYSDYVEERLVDLVSRYDIRMIYWDGADWNIRDSEVDFLDDPARQRLKVLGMKRLMQITERLYAIRPDLMIVAWNAWVDPHLLSIFDQEQVTDIFAAPVGEAELSRRKVYYGMSYIMPFSTIWSDWYGLAYSERKDISNLTLPESQLEYAELSMLSKGLKEAGGTLDLQQVRPEFRVFLKTLFTFRQRFDRYFEVYQRLSDLPDANRADASGHFLDGKGFIILNNPSNISQQLQLTLDPALLGLTPGKTYQLYDWTDLKFAKRYSALSFNSDGRSASLALHLPPHTVRILALDISGNEPRNPLPAQVREGS